MPRIPYVLIILLLSLKAYANDSSPKADLIIELADKAQVDHGPLLKLLKDRGYEVVSTFPRLGVLGLKSKKELKDEPCKELRKLDEVTLCSLNADFEPHTNYFSDPSLCRIRETFLSDDRLLSLRLRRECELIESHEPNINGPELSSNWAHEYTGADLLREMVPAMKAQDVQKIIRAWDTNSGKHGEYVSSVIASQKETGVIPLEEGALTYSDFGGPEQAMGTMESCFDDCPHYVNLSMGWDDEITDTKIEELSEARDMVFVVSAGNNNREVDASIKRLTQSSSIISVGNLGPRGAPSPSTSFGDEVVISAPSDHFLRSHDDEGNMANFGGTSGAAPQVTGALAAFTILTGLNLNLEQSRELIEKTALPFANLPTPSRVGHGMLNAYRIALIAKRLVEDCGDPVQVSCADGLLQDDNYYSFTPNDQKIEELISKFDELVPSCDPEDSSPLALKGMCEEGRELLKELRAMALEYDRPELWERLACAYKREGYEQNAAYYRDQQLRHELSDQDLMTRIQEDPELIAHAGYVRDQQFFQERGGVTPLFGDDQSIDFHLAYIEGLNLSKRDSSGENFELANLPGANFSESSLENAIFRRTTAPNSLFNGSNLKDADMSNSFLMGADFRGVSDFTGLRLTQAKLSGANFEGADLRNAQFYETDLAGANLAGADLRNDNFYVGHFLGRPMARAFLRGAQYSSETKFPEGMDPEEFGMIKID